MTEATANLLLALVLLGMVGCESTPHPTRGNVKQWGIWWNCAVSHKDRTTYESSDGPTIRERVAVCYGRDDWK